MKKITAIIVFILFATSTRAQTWSESVLGYWMSQDDAKAKIEIYKKDNKYYGKIVWLREPNDPDTGKPKTDEENPDEAKQNQPILGLVILKGFEFKEGFWQNGTIYDPENGKTYDCEMWLDGKTGLKIRGYWGFVYRTETWTRAK